MSYNLLDEDIDIVQASTNWDDEPVTRPKKGLNKIVKPKIIKPKAKAKNTQPSFQPSFQPTLTAQEKYLEKCRQQQLVEQSDKELITDLFR